MKIYTRTGDRGETGIIGGRVKKNSTLIEAIGNLDELNAHIGQLVSTITESRNKDKYKDELETLAKIQSLIFSIGSLLAGSKISIDLEIEVKEIEDKIDQIELQLTPLQNFILPGGSQISSKVHITRAVCRRCERRIIDIKEEKIREFVDILKFFNRLSDYLFVLSRLVNKIEGFEETIWKYK